MHQRVFRSPGIDSKPGGPVRQPYLAYWPARLHRLAESIPRNRFLGPFNVYKYGLRKELNSSQESRGGKGKVVSPTIIEYNGENVFFSVVFTSSYLSNHDSIWLLPVISLVLTCIAGAGAFPYDWRGFVGA